MDPIVGAQIALAAGSLVNQMMNGSSSKALARDNLNFQKAQAAQSMMMSQAGREDAAGNKTYYDAATNTWKTKLTPLQQAIQSAQQTETSRSLNEDAPRARRLRERLAQNSEAAASPYNKAIQGYLYDQPKTEGAIEDKLQTNLIQANADKAKEGQANVVRQSLRGGGNVRNLPAIIKAIDDKVAGTTSDSILRASEGAHKQFISDTQAHDSHYLPEIQQWAQVISNGGGDAGGRFDNANAQLAGSQANQASAMQAAIQSAMTGSNAAVRSSIAANTANKFDPSSLIKVLGSMNKKDTTEDWDKRPSKVDYSTIPDYLNNVEYGRTDSNGFSF